MGKNAWGGFILNCCANFILIGGYVATGFIMRRGWGPGHQIHLFGWGFPYWALLLISLLVASAIELLGRLIGGELNPQTFRPFKQWKIPVAAVIAGTCLAFI